jgi:3-methyladenine DNA glycosylase AlkD
MTFAETLAELEAAGSAQTRKTYSRHGVRGPMFGVSYAVLGKLTKKIKTDHALAGQLWASGNHDARILATMVADPARIDARTAEAWAKVIDNSALADAFAGLVARSPSAAGLTAKWVKAKNDLLCAAGWGVLARLAKDGGGDDGDYRNLLAVIEKEIHGSPNRTRYAMNGAVIAIGTRNAACRKAATEAAKRIGPVEVDHGDTDCKTPDAVTYIKKIWDRTKR